MQQAGFEYLETKRAALPDISFLKNINWKKYFKDEWLPLVDWEEITFYTKRNAWK